MRILNTIKIYDLSTYGVLFFMAGVVLAIVVFWIAIYKDNAMKAIMAACILLFLFIFRIVAERVYIPYISDVKYQYEVIVLDGKANQMLAEYDIIERRGEIYVLEERDEVSEIHSLEEAD